MRLSEKSLRTVGLAVVLAAAAVCGTAQPPQQQLQQQQVPDAPRPQTLPQLKTITPVAPAVQLPSAPKPVLNTTLPPEDAPVPTALPSSPQAQTPAPGDQDPAPEGTDPGQGVGAFKIRAPDVNFVEVPFTVKDNKNHLVPGLTYRDVRVYENNVRQTPRVFTTDPFPLSVALVIDQSVTFDVMEKINRSLAALQGAFTPYDEVAVFTYASHVTGHPGKGGEVFTGAQSALLGVLLERSKGKGREVNMNLGGPLAQGAVINNQAVPSPGGRPGPASNGYAEKEYHTLNDAILAAGQAAARAGKGRRRIVFIISDGKEYGSTAKEKDVIKYLQTNKVAVYATLVGDSSIPGLGFLDRMHLPLTMRDNALPRYAAATGGQIDPEFRQGGIEQSFAKITEEVRTQYTVGYYSHEPLIDGKFRKIEVRVLRPDLTVIAKEGYYPTASDSRPLPVTPTAVP